MNKETKKFHLIALAGILAIAVFFAVAQTGASKAIAVSPTASTVNTYEKRCGWFVNPTPANAWLIDRDGEWIIGTQGGNQAEGDWPSFKKNQWVKTNGSYGYGCACMNITANQETKEVTEIKSAYAQSLSVCRKDRSLKEPKD